MTVPKPQNSVTYATSSNEPNHGVLYLFGDPKSSKIALLCAGFDDDHAIFLPFAKALSESSSSEGNVFCGVMCMPGYDDRPEDGVPWTSHKKEGYTAEELTAAVRAASKALRGASENEDAKLTGIFHDWGVVPGTLWANRLEQEESSDLDRIVFFDVLGAPNSKARDRPDKATVPKPSFRETISLVYQPILAATYYLQLYLSKHLAVVFMVGCFALLNLLGIAPLQAFDVESKDAIYGKQRRSISYLLHMVYMTYPYALLMPLLVGRGFRLHQDWKKTPVLYVYGKKKNTQFHTPMTLQMLLREESEGRSISKAIGIEGAGHWLYIQKHDECLKYVVDFMTAQK